MKIVVLIKQVPDTWSDRKISLDTGRVDRSGELVADEITERALEVALTQRESAGGEVIALAMGPADAEEALRKCLAMGADRALLVSDPALAGADATGTARVLAAAIAREGCDVVLAGFESTDGRGGVIPAMLAELLERPLASALDDVELAGNTVRGHRRDDDASLLIEAELPAIVSVTESAAEARFPNFMGIMRARKKPLAVWSLKDLGLEPVEPRTHVVTVAERPPRSAGTVITDEGDAAKQLVDFLADRNLV